MDENWSAPRTRLGRGESWDEFLVEVSRCGLARLLDVDEFWTHRGRQVRNGVFGVVKPRAPEKQMIVVDEFGVETLKNFQHLTTF